MNAQTLSALRIIVMLACSSLATRGLLTKETAATLSDPATIEAFAYVALALGAAVWGIWSRRPHGIIKDAAALPQVDAVITKPKTADEIPDANVVGSLTEASRIPGVTAR
jgi:hypothetical protein